MRKCYNCDIDLPAEVSRITILRANFEGSSSDDRLGTVQVTFCESCFNSSADDELKKEDVTSSCVYCKSEVFYNKDFYYLASYKRIAGSSFVHSHMHKECYDENIGIFPKEKTLVWDSLSNPISTIIQASARVLGQHLGQPETLIVAPETLKQLENLEKEFQKSCREYLRKNFLKVYEHRTTNSIIRERKKSYRRINLRRDVRSMRKT